MNSNNREIKDDFSEILKLLIQLNRSYSLKRKRLKFMRLATVSREIVSLRNNFDSLWLIDGDYYQLKASPLSRKGIEILTGVFGNLVDVTNIFEADKGIAALDEKQFRKFLAGRISSGNAVDFLYSVFFGDDDSIIKLVKKQIPYIGKILPVIKSVDANGFEELKINKSDFENLKDFINLFNEVVHNLSEDTRLYRRFVKDFRKLFNEPGNLEVIGYGEISTVMEISKGKIMGDNNEIICMQGSGWIWKKMPPFPDIDEVIKFEILYGRYREILVSDIGINVPHQKICYFRHEKNFVVYAGQEKADTRSVCHHLVKNMNSEDAGALLEKILESLKRVHNFNISGGNTIIGFDGQLSNWVLECGNDWNGRVSEDDKLLYIDTSSPLIRTEGKELLNTEIFIKSAASFLRPVIRKFFLQEVLDRYYDMRSVAIDLIANLHKEKRKDLIDGFIRITNRFLEENSISEKAITRKEIDKYYLEDAKIWKFVQAAKKIDRFITENIQKPVQFKPQLH